MELIRLRIQFRLGSFRRLYVFGVLALLLATPGGHAMSSSDSLTSSALSHSNAVMNPDSPAFKPKSGDTGLKASSFGLTFDNVTKRDVKKPDVEDETVIPEEFDGSGGLGDGSGSRGGYQVVMVLIRIWLDLSSRLSS